MSKLLRSLLLIFAFLAVVCAALYGRKIPFAQQWPVFEALRTTASIVFAVVGAWMAIAYPERLKLSLRGESRNTAPVPRMAALLTPITHSTVILAIVLLVGVVAPVLRSMPVAREHLEWFRAASYAMATGLTLWQVAIVLLTLRPADGVKRSDDLAHATQRRLQSVFGNSDSE